MTWPHVLVGRDARGARDDRGARPVARPAELTRDSTEKVGTLDPFMLRLLGPLELVGLEGTVTVGGAKRRSLLALLAARAAERTCGRPRQMRPP